MSLTVNQIESAIEKLPPQKVSELSERFAGFEARVWDKKIAGHIQNGNLLIFTEEAEKDFTEGNCQPM